MRVAIDGRVITDHFPGIGRYTYHMIDALATAAPTDHFIVLHNPDQADARYDLAKLDCHSNVSLLPIRASIFSLTSQWAVPRAIKTAAADTFHATYWLTAYRPGVPTALSIYDLIGLRAPQAVPQHRRLALAMSLRLALGTADEVLTLSEASKADLLAGSRLSPSRVTVAPPGVDDRFRPADEATVARLRSRLGLPGRYILYLGINKPHKNLLMLIEAWDRLAGRLPRLVAGADGDGDGDGVGLVLAGPWDPRYEEPRRAAAALAAGASVRFLGPVPDADLPALYTGAAAFAFPSRYEGFGLPPLEAMACGAPVIAANATSLPAVVGDAGLLVGVDDIDGWVDALARLLTDPDLAAELRRRGPQRAATFTWAETARRTMEVYRRLTAGSASG